MAQMKACTILMKNWALIWKRGHFCNIFQKVVCGVSSLPYVLSWKLSSEDSRHIHFFKTFMQQTSTGSHLSIPQSDLTRKIQPGDGHKYYSA